MFLRCVQNSGGGTKPIIPLVPKMTSNTTPYGEAGATSMYQSFYPYYAFDQDSSTVWVCQGFTSGVSKLWYRFRKPTCVKKVQIGGTNVNAKTFKIQVSNDGNEWLTIFTGESHTDTETEDFELENTGHYLYYAYTGLTQKTSGQFQVSSLQYYGYEKD